MSSMRLALKLSMDASMSSSTNNNNSNSNSSSSSSSNSSHDGVDKDKDIKKKNDDNKKTLSKDNDNTEIKETKIGNKNDHKEKKDKKEKPEKAEKAEKAEKTEKTEKAEKVEKVEKNEKPDKQEKLDKKADHTNEKSSYDKIGNSINNKRKRAESEGDHNSHLPKNNQKRSMSLDQIDEEPEIPTRKKMGNDKQGEKSSSSISNEDSKKGGGQEEMVKKPKIEKEKKVKGTNNSENSIVNSSNEEENVENIADNTGVETPIEKFKNKKRKPQGLIGELQNAEVVDEAAENTPRYQSNRAAAILAKTKLSNAGGGTRISKPDQDEDEKENKEKKKKTDENAITSEDVDDAKWVQCDTCTKWRCLPSHVDMETLPEQWHCQMNIWDDTSNNCDAPEMSGNENSGAQDDNSPPVRLKGRWAGHIPKHKRNQMKSTGDEDEAVTAKKRGQMQQKSADKVDWVQCNKCNKWRKVPMTIDVGALPEEWFCSLNTWNPMVARCTAKEEVDSLPIEDDIDRSAAKGKKGNSTNTSVSSGLATSGENVKKVTQWVQCERRNCKKWRKVPAHINAETLPEKWYCEMNVWDSERGSCDDPEPADSEDEKQQIATDRAQLLFANSKGPGALSYRRLIFGTDGKIRPSYNEKNKSVYGLFSFTEVHKQVDNEDYIEPTRRLSYWSSSAYDVTGVTKNEVPKKDKDKKDKEKEVEKEKIPSPISKTGENFKLKQERSILLDSIKKLSGSNLALSANEYYGSKSLKSNNFTVFERFKQESKIVRSILLTSSNKKLSFNNLVEFITTSNFLNADEEACRRSMNLDDIKATVRRLEIDGELEISLNGSGDILIQSLKPCLSTEDPWNDTKWCEKGLPLRFRKRKDSIKAFKDDIKREEDEKRRIKRRKEAEEEEKMVAEEKKEEEDHDEKIEDENISTGVDFENPTSMDIEIQKEEDFDQMKDMLIESAVESYTKLT